MDHESALYKLGELVRWFTYSSEMVITNSGIGPIIEIHNITGHSLYAVLQSNKVVLYSHWELEKIEKWTDEL